MMGMIFLSGCADQQRVEMVKVDHIQSVSASSFEPSYPPALVLDGGTGPGKAWHSAVRPAFPQWIQVGYPEAVVLERIAIQAQQDEPTGRTDLLRRAPRRVELLGANEPEFRNYQRIAKWECRFEKAGSWFIMDLPAASPKALFFRLIIWDNYGDSDYVTIQEMNFFSRE
jgi:hypothetical protein